MQRGQELEATYNPFEGIVAVRGAQVRAVRIQAAGDLAKWPARIREQ